MNIGITALETLSLFKDSDRWTRFSDAARTNAVERFSNDRVLPTYEGLYRDVVNGDFEG